MRAVSPSAPRALGVMLLSAAALWLGSPAPAAAQEPLAIEGRVVNGTGVSAAAPGLTVVFHRADLAGRERRELTTDSNGGFRFEGIVFDAESIYGVTVSYQGAVYGTDLDLSDGSPPPVLLTVYESDSNLTSISVDTASVLLAEADRARETVWAMEIVKLVNDTDRTYVPGPDPMSLLRFGLPPGTRDLQVDTNLPGANVIQVDRGFGLTGTVPPGEHEVMYAYRFPYSRGAARIAKSLPYGAAALRVLAPVEVAQLSSPELDTAGVVTIGGRPYRLLEGSDLPRGTSISLELTSLPQASLADRLRARVDDTRLEYMAAAALGLLMLALIGFAVSRRGSLRSGPTSMDPPARGRGNKPDRPVQ